MTTHTPTQEIRDAWDAVATGFDEFVTPQMLGLGEEVVGRLGLGPGMRFLDVGTGSGALAIPAARLGARVVAVDIAPGMIERKAVRDATTTVVSDEIKPGSSKFIHHGYKFVRHRSL